MKHPLIELARELEKVSLTNLPTYRFHKLLQSKLIQAEAEGRVPCNLFPHLDPHNFLVDMSDEELEEASDIMVNIVINMYNQTIQDFDEEFVKRMLAGVSLKQN